MYGTWAIFVSLIFMNTALAGDLEYESVFGYKLKLSSSSIISLKAHSNGVLVVDSASTIKVVFNGVDKGSFRAGAYHLAPASDISIESTHDHVVMAFGEDPFSREREAQEKLEIELFSKALNLPEDEKIITMSEFAIAGNGGASCLIIDGKKVIAQSEPGFLKIVGSETAFILTSKKKYPMPNIVLTAPLS